jgi:hypothetical protein
MRDRTVSGSSSARTRAPARAITQASSGLLVPISLSLALALFVTGARAQGSASAASVVVAQSTTAQDRAKQIAAADTEIRVARDELDTARRRYEAGRKETSADRVNQLEGGGAQTDAFYLRVEHLKSVVTKAQERLDHAINARKALGE